MKSIQKKDKKIEGKYSSPQQPVLEDNDIITDQKEVNKLRETLAAISQGNRYKDLDNIKTTQRH